MADLQNELTWSVSRDRLFSSCPRAYYYQYYGSWGGWDRSSAPRAQRIYLLKNMVSLPMWAGSIVHETIAEALNRFARTGQPIQTGDLQARARQKLRNGWLEAVNREWLARPKKTNLHELYYGDRKHVPKEKTEDTKERVYGCLEAFATSPVLRRIQTIPYLNWKPVDALDAFLVDGLKVWCAVDFAYTDQAGKLHIIDWKTGAEDRDKLAIQLACYALYAAEKWHTPVGQSRLFGVFLSDDARVSEYPVTPDMTVETKGYILDSATRMRALLRDVHANAAEEDDFPCCENERICARCNYREVCPFIDGDGNLNT